MNRVKVIDLVLENTENCERLINNAISEIEAEGFSVDCIEYFACRNGFLKTVVIEYSDNE